MTNTNTASEAAPQSPVVITPDRASEYLRTLDIKTDVLRSALLQGQHEAENRDDMYYPKTAAGLGRWMETIHCLRASMDESELWSVEVDHNRPVMRKDGATYEVTVARATSETGNPDSTSPPRPVARVGVKTVESVNRFQGRNPAALFQFSDVLLAPKDPINGTPMPPPGTWFLLYNLSDEGIHCEFSLAANASGEGEITDWAVRVILDTVTEWPDGKPLTYREEQGGDDVLFNID